MNQVSRKTLIKKTKQAAATPKPAKVRANVPFGQADVIRVLVAGNPCKSPEGKNYRRWQAGVSDGRTVADTIAAGFTMADIKCCVGRKWLKVEPAPKSSEA